MENNNTNTDYHKFVRVGDQKWEIVEITIRIIFFFFCLRYVFTIFYTGSFQVPPKKNYPHLKCQFPPKIPICPKSLLHKRSEKWLSLPRAMSILTEYTYSFLLDSGLFPDEQKRCKRGSYGCKNQLLINKVILENCHNCNTNLSISWIDYKKAFDNVPQSWIKRCLEMFKISPYETFSLTACVGGKQH